MIDVLAIFAHPDDVELYVGGTLLKLKSFGLRTGVLDVTRGEMGTRGTLEIRAKGTGININSTRDLVAKKSSKPTGTYFGRIRRSLVIDRHRITDCPSNFAN
jgi:LmbE family N-acetylglucosaminyl deacetylase